MYKVLIDDGITFIEDDELAKQIVKDIKKTKGFFY